MWPKFLIFFVIFVVASGSFPAFARSPSQLYAALDQAISREKDAARAWVEWERERAVLEQKILKLKMEIAYLEYEKKKYENYRNTAKARFERLQTQKEGAGELILNLERFLYDTVDRLDEAIRNDIPFHQEKRLDRLAQIRKALADYSISLSEKARLVMETLLTEAQYGRSVEVYEGMLEDGGEERYVQFLRVGRLALFCSPPDRSFVNFYDPLNREWKPLPEVIEDPVKSAFDRVQKGESVELSESDFWLTLPVANKRVEK